MITRAAIVLLLVAAIPRAGLAADDGEAAYCRYVAARSSEWIRDGEIDKVREFKNSLEACQPILKEALRREVQQLLERVTTR